MSNLNISNLSYLTDIKDCEKSVIGGLFRQRNDFGLDAFLVGDVNQVTVANAQGNNVGGDQVVIANAQSNLALGKGNRQENDGEFFVVL
ncbi:MAG: hypothetical protein AAGE84_00920 [Cyanobacteria bacterium P01_G01_bin.39]